MSHITRITYAAQQQAARQGTQLDDLLPRLESTNERELADTLLMLINSRHDQRATAAETDNARLRELLDAERVLARAQEREVWRLRAMLDEWQDAHDSQ